ncbi:MAG: hypothetical protein KFF73_20045 [Cyclobacteriaceae bacterium]|nr:hypothetical protein [Cyclobacteriaceae bacterium]
MEGRGGARNRVRPTDYRATHDLNKASNNMTRNQNRYSIQSKPSSGQNDANAEEAGNVYRWNQKGNVQERSNRPWNTASCTGSHQPYGLYETTGNKAVQSM